MRHSCLLMKNSDEKNEAAIQGRQLCSTFGLPAYAVGVLLVQRSLYPSNASLPRTCMWLSPTSRGPCDLSSHTNISVHWVWYSHSMCAARHISTACGSVFVFNTSTACAHMFNNPQVPAVVGLSVLELCMLVAAQRLEDAGSCVFNFQVCAADMGSQDLGTVHHEWLCKR